MHACSVFREMAFVLHRAVHARKGDIAPHANREQTEKPRTKKREVNGNDLKLYMMAQVRKFRRQAQFGIPAMIHGRETCEQTIPRTSNIKLQQLM